MRKNEEKPFPRLDPSSLFTAEDKRQIKEEGLTLRQVMSQINLFQKGVPFIELNRSARISDGIDVVHEGEQDRYIALHEEAAQKGRLLKFVPASGAATRMFMEWYRALEDGRSSSEAVESGLARDLEKYAFVPDLRNCLQTAGLDLDVLRSEKKYLELITYILTSKGLNYGQLPKALLKFHTYPTGSRTALEEHLAEAVQYVRDASKISRLHITVSENHRALVLDHLAQVIKAFENLNDVIFDIDLSIQESGTNTIALDMENHPFRSDTGRLCFRPGGHGALLENLIAIDGDIIFLKNIDNVVPDRLKAMTILYKKILCGYLVSLQASCFQYLRLLDKSGLSDRELSEASAFCREKMHTALPVNFEQMKGREKRQCLFSALNRPLRVCGMVRNEGEPGGGPFWINDTDGLESLQIIEASQVDPLSESQKKIWQSATHFNPVDLICGVRDYRGEKFDLRRFVNPQTAAITKKTEKGRELKALEHPGLWNGSMAYWNTVFVEVPIETFNPVKTVEDLLRPSHQPL